MKCKGSFVFKSISHRDAGVFKNDKGEDVKYPSAYILKVDEINENGDPNERKFKIDDKKADLINTLKTFKVYDGIVLEFNITIFNSRIGMEIVSVEEDEEF